MMELKTTANCRGMSPERNVLYGTCCRSIFRPVMFSMKIFGLYFDKRDKLRSSYCTVSSKVYSLIVLVLLWLNIVRYVPAFFVGVDFKANLTVFRVIVFVWLLLGTLNATIMFHGCRKHMPSFCEMWSSMHSCEAYSRLHVEQFIKKQHVRRRVLIWSTIGWIVVAFNLITLSFLVFGPIQTAREIYGTAIANPAPPTTWAKSISVFISIFNTAAWIFPLVNVITLCLVIGCEFEIISKALEAELKNQASNKVFSSLEYIRTLHNQACQLVGCIDKIVSLWIMTAYVTNIPLACFIQYSLINGGLDMVTFSVELFWLLTCLVYVCVVSIVSSQVMNKAHSPLEHIYNISLAGATHEELGQLNLFLSKLNGPSIGFTAMGLITVTKEVILTLAGLYLTYFFLLLQFKI